MATIVPFTPKAGPPSRRESQQDEPATIVIFPGVRYEHLPGDKSNDEAVVAAPAASKSHGSTR